MPKQNSRPSNSVVDSQLAADPAMAHFAQQMRHLRALQHVPQTFSGTRNGARGKATGRRARKERKDWGHEH